MTLPKLIIRNLVFYRRTNTGTLLGVALATAILVGALVVGDSVRYSLQDMVAERLGKTEYALDMGDRYFRIQLADDLENNLSTTVAPILRTRGMAITPGTSQQARPVQIAGVDERFEDLNTVSPSLYHLQDNEVVINEELASNLDLKPGDSFLLRLLKISYLSTDAPFSRDTDLSIAVRVQIKAVASVTDFGHFNLKSHQIVPNTVFISLSYLNDLMELNNRANILLVSERKGNTLKLGELQSELNRISKFEDIGLNLALLNDLNQIELKSDHIFIQQEITDIIRKINSKMTPVFTYFVNEIKAGNRITPYSFVSAPGAPIIPQGMKDDEIVINSWLSNDLGINRGGSITLKYYIIGSNRSLLEKQSTFSVKSVVPTSGIYADQKLMPEFPGLAGEENCRDWDPGIPVDLDKIRKQDENYWDAHGGTPKAFITLKAAQNLWQNRFGNLTAIRFDRVDLGNLEQEINSKMHPEEFGFVFQPQRQEGVRASQESVDFAELFLGLSFFVMIAALILTSLLFVLTIGQRSGETGLYVALGYKKNQIRRILMYEYALISLLGGVIGALLGIFYTQIILIALGSIWRGAVGTTALTMHIEPATIVTGIAAGSIISILSMFWTIRKQLKKSVVELQADVDALGSAEKRGLTRYSLPLAMLTSVLAISLVIFLGVGKGENAGIFFGSGFLLLISGLAFTAYFFNRIHKKSVSTKLSLSRISLENMTRNKGRSLMLVGLIASGLFIIFTVGANRQGKIRNPYERSAGTGGFALMGQSQMPVLYDLNSDKGREFYMLDDLSGGSAEFVSFRIKEGDDASCLNLNRVTSPQLLGVDPAKLNSRGAFTFSSFSDDVDAGNPWLILESDLGNNVIPGIADETVIIWGLGKSVGDTISYRDERGNTFYIKLVAGLANSIFQGNIIVSEKILMEKYPSVSGHRLFLIDVSAESTDSLSKSLSWALQDLGLEITSTSERLAAFNQVENTYLSIFLILGGLGLILGTIGLGIVVTRNILERRGELALLRAVGFNSGRIRNLILSEHVVLLLIGTACGSIASIIAMLPALVTPGTEVPYLTIIIILVTIIASGVTWTYLAIALAAKGDLLPALRNE